MAQVDSFEDRLKSHAAAFNGLLSLIPAKVYYGEDTSDQWQRKKQTKAEARAARLAKLDPANTKSALDVIQENERKRKREGVVGNDGIAAEKVTEESSRQKPVKKQRTEVNPAKILSPEEDEAIRSAKRDKRKQKRDGKKARKEELQAKQLEKKVLKEEDARNETDRDAQGSADLQAMDLSGLDEGGHETESDDEDGHDWEDASSNIEPEDPVSASEKDDSPAFDFSEQQSGTSSVSSAGTVEAVVKLKAKNAKPKPLPQLSTPSNSAGSEAEPKLTMEQKQERLRQRLAALRAARKADVDGHAAKTRAELLDSRRKKQDSRKERKKALRQQAKEEEQRQREETMARGSPLMSPAIRSSPPGETENNFAFGRVAFENGQAMTADLSGILDVSKRKGPSDLKTAMLAANAKNARLSGLNPEQRAEIAEKDLWLTARKRAHGEKAKDDQSLLKKALKRKDKQKEKSTNDWKKRIEGVKIGKEVRQKKREENLAKRKEDKGKKGGKSSKPPKKQKKRPGFEGSFRAGRKK